LSTNILQGSVATRLSCGGVFDYNFRRNLCLVYRWKNFENRLVFGKSNVKNTLPYFSGHSVWEFLFISENLIRKSFWSLSVFD